VIYFKTKYSYPIFSSAALVRGETARTVNERRWKLEPYLQVGQLSTGRRSAAFYCPRKWKTGERVGGKPQRNHHHPTFLTQHSFGPNHVYLGTKTFHNFQSISPVLITRKIFKILASQTARREIKAKHFHCLHFVCYEFRNSLRFSVFQRWNFTCVPLGIVVRHINHANEMRGVNCTCL